MWQRHDSLKLSCFYGLYLSYYGLDFDKLVEELKLKSDWFYSKVHKNQYSNDIIITSFLIFCYYAKWQHSATNRYLSTTIHST